MDGFSRESADKFFRFPVMRLRPASLISSRPTAMSLETIPATCFIACSSAQMSTQKKPGFRLSRPPSRIGQSIYNIKIRSHLLAHQRQQFLGPRFHQGFVAAAFYI